MGCDECQQAAQAVRVVQVPVLVYCKGGSNSIARDLLVNSAAALLVYYLFFRKGA